MANVLHYHILHTYTLYNNITRNKSNILLVSFPMAYSSTAYCLLLVIERETDGKKASEWITLIMNMNEQVEKPLSLFVCVCVCACSSMACWNITPGLALTADIWQLVFFILVISKEFIKIFFFSFCCWIGFRRLKSEKYVNRCWWVLDDELCEVKIIWPILCSCRKWLAAY